MSRPDVCQHKNTKLVTEGDWLVLRCADCGAELSREWQG